MSTREEDIKHSLQLQAQNFHSDMPDISFAILKMLQKAELKGQPIQPSL